MSDMLRKGIEHGFIDSNTEASIDYIPRLLTNEPEKGNKVLFEVTKELSNCIEFRFCVAFLTMSGIQVLINSLNNLRDKGIKGIIIVSKYQNFTEPNALRKLLEYDIIDLRIAAKDNYNLHSKGYIFRRSNDEYSIIVGSSNITQNALCSNKEWNVKLNSLKDGEYAKLVLDEFNEVYNNSMPVTKVWVDEYEKVYNSIKKSIKIDDSVIISSEIKPNSMQTAALEELEKLRASGNDKALVISSTGTGKTILCALDVKQYKPKKMLFVIHRENICHAALRTFKRVLGNDIKACILGGGNAGDITKANYVFAMVQTISKDNYLEMFDKEEFDYIVFDEAHHLGAPGTRKVFDYFKPKFVLGMTATPERMDNFDIFKLFNYNIACEIRLNDAMKYDLICPFHYYGVTDITVNGEMIKDDEDFSNLTSEERVKHILNKIEEYGYSGDKVKGLVFVSRVEEAKFLSDEFNKAGYRTIALSGADNEATRERAINMLESDDPKEYLDYIFTVDIFNEGIDIQKVNQVVMLRPTESAIIFVQQLGRGLRKNEDKEYLIVIDFIGNYDNNFLIPIALSGDRSYNKDNIRKFIKEGNKTIYGPSTIEFEKIVEDKIFEKLDKAKLNDAKIIKQSYFGLKNKLGRIPELEDFEKYNAIDVVKIFDKYGSYHNFLARYDDEYVNKLDKNEELYLELVSSKYGSAKKVFEAEFLKILINNLDGCFEDVYSKFISDMKKKYPTVKYDKLLKDNIKNQMNGEYFIANEKESYSSAKFIFGEEVDKNFKNCINDDDFKLLFDKILNYIIDRHNKEYRDYYLDSLFVLNKKYTYDDVFRVLNSKKNYVATNVGGYMFEPVTNTIPVFINYEKADDINDSIKYQDKFIDRNILSWVSKNNRTLKSPDVQRIIDADDNKTIIYLFVRKNKDDKESKEFYFLGKMNVIDTPKEIRMASGDKAVEITYKLHTSVREDLYDYIARND